MVITGCDSMEILRQALHAARSFQPMNSSQVARNGWATTMELLATNQMMRACILLLIGARIFLPALGGAQTVPLPEPRQVRANWHVVSLTLRAVSENSRNAFAFDGASVAPVIGASPGSCHTGLDSSHRRW